jgi:UDP-4-amino-4,6-dideoxy-N-acetyl-beta-L-altrosamine transaminase
MRAIHYGRQAINKEDIRAVIKVLRSDWITQGPKVKEFEDALCKYTGAKYAVAVSSGTAALHIACLASGLKKGEEAITSPITFVASANCILYCQAKPVFVDIQDDTANINPDKIKKNITKKTKVIIPVHFSGNPCDMEEINLIAKNNHLTVIEDACHALGAEYKGSKIGSCKYSDMAVFSFHPVKSITTGEGGAILTNNKKYYERLLMLRSHGITKNKSEFLSKSEGKWFYEMQELGFNYRITDFQCALGLSQLKRLDRFLARRREIASSYLQKLNGIDKISLPVERPYVKSSWHIFCIKVLNAKRRFKLFESLRSYGISPQVHYIPVYSQPYYRRLLGAGLKNSFPVSERYYRQTLTLPIYPGLMITEMNYVVRKIKNFFK